MYQAVSQIVDSSKVIIFTASELRLEDMFDFVVFCNCIHHHFKLQLYLSQLNCSSPQTPTKNPSDRWWKTDRIRRQQCNTLLLKPFSFVPTLYCGRSFTSKHVKVNITAWHFVLVGQPLIPKPGTLLWQVYWQDEEKKMYILRAS